MLDPYEVSGSDDDLDTYELEPYTVYGDGSGDDQWDDYYDEFGYEDPYSDDLYYDGSGGSGSGGSTTAPSTSSTTTTTGSPPPAGPVNADDLRNDLDFDPDGTSEVTNAILNPIDAVTADSLADEARDVTAQLYPGVVPWNNEADAFRHTYWNFRMSEELGIDESKAFADAHEVSNPNFDGEQLMNLWNNDKGRDLYDLNPDGDPIQAIQDAIAAGEIKTTPFQVSP